MIIWYRWIQWNRATSLKNKPEWVCYSPSDHCYISGTIVLRCLWWWVNDIYIMHILVWQNNILWSTSRGVTSYTCYRLRLTHLSLSIKPIITDDVNLLFVRYLCVCMVALADMRALSDEAQDRLEAGPEKYTQEQFRELSFIGLRKERWVISSHT